MKSNPFRLIIVIILVGISFGIWQKDISAGLFMSFSCLFILHCIAILKEKK